MSYVCNYSVIAYTSQYCLDHRALDQVLGLFWVNHFRYQRMLFLVTSFHRCPFALQQLFRVQLGFADVHDHSLM